MRNFLLINSTVNVGTEVSTEALSQNLTPTPLRRGLMASCYNLELSELELEHAETDLR